MNARFLKLDEDIENLHAPDRNNFSPRIGIAYLVTPKWVIRAGGGVFFGQPRGSEFSSFQLSPPFVIGLDVDLEPVGAGSGGALVPADAGYAMHRGAFFFPRTPTSSRSTRISGQNYTYQWNFGIQHELRGMAA